MFSLPTLVKEQLIYNEKLSRLERRVERSRYAEPPLPLAAQRIQNATSSRAGARFEYQIDALTVQQLTDYFSELLASHSWSAVKHDLYGLKFYYEHVLHQPWVAPGLIKPSRVQALPDIVTVAQAQHIFMATRVLSYRVFFYTLYSLGLRLGEGLRLQVGDIDAQRQRVHIRDAKGNRDRFVPLPASTLITLRRYWKTHRNPVLLFPNRHGGLKRELTCSNYTHTPVSPRIMPVSAPIP